MSQIDMGTGSTLALDMIAVSVSPGETVTVNNLAGSTLNYYANTCSTPAGTIAASANQAFTVPVWVQSQGRSSVRFTGGKFGNI